MHYFLSQTGAQGLGAQHVSKLYNWSKEIKLFKKSFRFLLGALNVNTKNCVAGTRVWLRQFHLLATEEPAQSRDIAAGAVLLRVNTAV